MKKIILTLMCIIALSTIASALSPVQTLCWSLQNGTVCINGTTQNQWTGVKLNFSDLLNVPAFSVDTNNYTTGISYSGKILSLTRSGMTTLTATIPNNAITLDATNITSGTLDTARIPTQTNAHTLACQNITGTASNLCTIVDTDTNTGTTDAHLHAAQNITGTIADNQIANSSAWWAKGTSNLTATTCSAGNYSTYNGSTFICSPDTGGVSVDLNNYTTQFGITGTATKTWSLNRTGMTELTGTFTDIDTDTSNTTQQMINAVNNTNINIGGNAATVTKGVYTDTIVNLVGNWSLDKSSYSTTTQANNLYMKLAGADASNITSGTIAFARLPTLTNTLTLACQNITGSSSNLCTMTDTDTWNTTQQMINALNNSNINIGGNAATVNNGVYTNTIVGLVGNWSLDKASYATIANLASVGNWTSDKVNYNTTTQLTTILYDKSYALPDSNISSANIWNNKGNSNVTISDVNAALGNATLVNTSANINALGFPTSTQVAGAYTNKTKAETITGNWIFNPTTNTTFGGSGQVLFYNPVYFYNTVTLSNNTQTSVNGTIILQNIAGATIAIWNDTGGTATLWNNGIINNTGTIYENGINLNTKYNDTVALNAKASPGTCADGYYAQNTTTSGVQCVALGTVNVSGTDTLDGQHGTYYTNASNTISGTLAFARLPTLTNTITLDYDNITNPHWGSSNLTIAQVNTALGNATQNDAHTHNGINITNKAAFNNAITLDATNISAGTLALARLPALNSQHTHDAANITAGTLALARLPSLNSQHTHTAANITDFGTAIVAQTGNATQVDLDWHTQNTTTQNRIDAVNTTAIAASTLATVANNTATAANNTAAAAFPKAGGTLTGNVTLPSTAWKMVAPSGMGFCINSSGGQATGNITLWGGCA